MAFAFAFVPGQEGVESQPQLGAIGRTLRPLANDSIDALAEEVRIRAMLRMGDVFEGENPLIIDVKVVSPTELVR
jgi:hypothetical protein